MSERRGGPGDRVEHVSRYCNGYPITSRYRTLNARSPGPAGGPSCAGSVSVAAEARGSSTVEGRGFPVMAFPG